MYIKNKLHEPNIARNYAKQIKKELKTLEYNPQKFAVIDMEIKKIPNIRKLIIKNFIAFYIVDEKEKIVNIDRILYGASNWKDKI